MVVQEITRWRREVETFRDREIGRIRRGHPARAGTSGSPAAPGGRVATSRFEAAGALSRGHSRRRATASGQVFFAAFIASRRFRSRVAVLNRWHFRQVAGSSPCAICFSSYRSTPHSDHRRSSEGQVALLTGWRRPYTWSEVGVRAPPGPVLARPLDGDRRSVAGHVPPDGAESAPGARISSRVSVIEASRWVVAWTRAWTPVNIW